ncbi:hypothetical protein PR003_g31322 [Phytophthora rubi]|uniref:Sodium/calcium exchanger membrane region domain-containing protein n=1 Tax=Phytophthora rubi TaxID=129364 RepID=A0A6A4B9H9_9STRA|nr:hypothetical protein PR003_g31322 [Phytophthora rubi]
MYIQLLFFQLKTHADFFEDEQETPEEAAALVSLFSELLVGSIDGFATEMNVSKSFIGIILLPVVGNDVEHVTAVKASLNNKYTVLRGSGLAGSRYQTMVKSAVAAPTKPL